ncbi:MAG TPA: histidine phosphatase family protein [Candidatus Nanoarchaeia archaeon]|nr:histidine phosphatase family protein [Candidatus Nanoarchaeia archaeon]
MKIYAVRHCQSLANVKGIIDNNATPNGENDLLSEEGKEQARELAKKLEKYKIDKVIVSDFRRTKETVEPYLENHPLKLISLDLIRERNAGVFAGKPLNAVKLYCTEHNITDRIAFKPEQGESLLETYERVKQFVAYLKKNFKGEHILVCSHSRFLMCFNVLMQDIPIQNLYSSEEFKNGDIKEYSL